MMIMTTMIVAFVILISMSMNMSTSTLPLFSRSSQAANVHVLHRKRVESSGAEAMYCCCKTVAGALILCEVQVLASSARCAVRSDSLQLSQLVPPALQAILSQAH